MYNTSSGFLRIAGVCSIAAPILLLGSDIFHLLLGHDFEWTIGMWAAMVLFVPAVIGFAWSLAASGSRLAYLGGALAFFGAMAGASMQVLFRVHAVLAEQGAAQTVEQLRGTFKLVASTQMIGLAWPIGLLLLCVSLLMVNSSRWMTALLLAGGAIFFPIGRIAGSDTAVIISGILFVGAFGLIGRQMFSDSETPA
jgi:hypothetical protein